MLVRYGIEVAGGFICENCTQVSLGDRYGIVSLRRVNLVWLEFCDAQYWKAKVFGFFFLK